MKKIGLLFILFCITQTSFAQEGKAFKTSKQFYLKGSSALIGNTVLGVSSKKAFNNLNVYNDALNLRYTDVDRDQNTFSSSQAELQIPENKKIKYAALYWSAIYKYNKGVKKAKGKYLVYKEAEKSLPDINKIYFKTPNTSDYKPIDGTVVFDSKSTELFEDTQPYLCFADVTSLLQNSTTINGDYTVANIKATQGFVSGGSAGGWLLYIIYEDEDDTKKYFTTYDGFLGVDNTEVIIDFSDFKANETGLVNTSLLLATLEGDYKFKTDACAIKEAEKDRYVTLSSETRDKNNFFNSTISNFGQDKRNPSSLNTLGLDILKMPIPNKNNTIINNNSTNTSIKLSTKKDGFYLFFVAFETEISEAFVPKLRQENAITSNIDSKKEVIKNNNDSIITKQDLTLKPSIIRKDSIQKQPNPVITKQIITSTKQTTNITIPSNQSKLPIAHYYLVTNVFSVPENVTKWETTLLNLGYNPRTYFNQENSYYYVYILKDTDLSIINKEKQRLLDIKAFDTLNIKTFYN